MRLHSSKHKSPLFNPLQSRRAGDWKQIMKNIVAASILTIGMIVSAVIYLLTPKPGRYKYSEINDELQSLCGAEVFDTALGIHYTDSTMIKNGIRSLTIRNLTTGSFSCRKLNLPK